MCQARIYDTPHGRRTTASRHRADPQPAGDRRRPALSLQPRRPVLRSGRALVRAGRALLRLPAEVPRDEPEVAVRDRPVVALEHQRAEGLLVADMTANPPDTWLIRQAAERACTTVDGLGMYVEQSAAAVELWTGVSPDRTVMRDAVEEFLEV